MNLVRIYLEPKGREDVVCDFVEVRPDGTLKIIGGKRDEEFVERLANAGYTKITLKYSTTSIRGYYHTYALAK